MFAALFKIKPRIASQVMASTLSACKARGVKTAYMLADENALGFFESFGFEHLNL